MRRTKWKPTVENEPKVWVDRTGRMRFTFMHHLCGETNTTETKNDPDPPFALLKTLLGQITLSVQR